MTEILDIFGIKLELLIIQTINFGILLLALWYLLYRPVVRMMETRREKIEAGVREAEETAQERAYLESQKQSMLQQATAETERLVAEGKQYAAERRAELIQEAEARSESILKEAQERSEEERRQALAQNKEEIARLAILAAERVLRKKENGT